MSEKKIIAVVGATGAQGGGLARAILSDPDGPFAVRALTRDPSSDKARALADAGAEIVAADADDVGSLKRAFDGAYGAYCVTFFWEHFSSKAEANSAFTDLGVPTTFLLTSFYWENFIYFGSGPTRGPDGQLLLTFPMGDAKLPGIATEDIGKCAFGIFKRGPELVGRTIGISGEQLTGSQMAAALTNALGEEVRYNKVSADAYRGFGFPGAEDLGNMFQFKRDFEDDFSGARDPEFARSLNPSLLSFGQWLAENGGRIPIE
jgi:uncharacterized protein YbjT (DUF2867 family)